MKLRLVTPPPSTFQPGCMSVLAGIFWKMNHSVPVHLKVQALRTHCRLQR